MKLWKRTLLMVFAALLMAAPVAAQVETDGMDASFEVGQTESYDARVMEVLGQRSTTREDGSISVQQNLLLEIVKGERRGQRVEFLGISDIDVFNAQTYSVGDGVVVTRAVGPDGSLVYTVTDYVRHVPLFWLALLFVVTTAAVGGRKGFRALLALAASSWLIVKLVLPAIMDGHSPILVGFVGAFAVMVIIVYVTEGWSRKAHVAIMSVSFSLLVTLLLSVAFTYATRLTGMAQEETMFLNDVLGASIDFRGLLLAGILIGTIGVLDDIIIGQIEAVIQIREVNPSLSNRQTFVHAYKVGNAHFGAIINTLFLTYAGASLPLLLLFSAHHEPFLTFSDVLNNELIATEVVRTLVGGLGLAAAMPISTLMACRFLPSQAVRRP